MKYLDEYRDRELAARLVDRIARDSSTPAAFMEICGTHTVAIFRHGIRQVLPGHIRLISGPG